jgi:DNA-binding IclR family transcriptional regulator
VPINRDGVATDAMSVSVPAFRLAAGAEEALVQALLSEKERLRGLLHG